MTEIPELNPTPNLENMDRQFIPHAPALIERSLARRLALQALYELDHTQHKVEAVIAERLQTATNTPDNPLQLEEEDLNPEPPKVKMSAKVGRYATALILGVDGQREKLDQFISRYAPEWPLDQVAIVDRNILRLAVYELANEPDLPFKVIVAEALELATLFGADSSLRFINGVLGAVSDDLDSLDEVGEKAE